MKKILVLVMVAMFLAGGMVLMSCGSKCPGGGTSSGKGDCTLTATSAGDCTDHCIVNQIIANDTKSSYSCDC
jgi:hypothetical protein